MPSSKKSISFQEVGQKRKMVIKIQFTPLSLSDCIFFPFKKVLKMSKRDFLYRFCQIEFRKTLLVAILSPILAYWSTHRVEKEVFKENIIRCAAWELLNP